MTGLVGKPPVAYIHVEIAGGVGDHVNLEQNSNIAGDSGESSEGQCTGDDILVEIGVGEEAVGHEGEGDVHGEGLAGANVASRYGNLSNILASVLEDGGAVGEVEADSIGVVDGHVGVEADVQQHPQPEDVEREIDIPEGDGVDSGDRSFGFEDGEPQYQHDQSDHQYHCDDGGPNQHRFSSPPAAAAPFHLVLAGRSFLRGFDLHLANPIDRSIDQFEHGTKFPFRPRWLVIGRKVARAAV